MMTLHKTNLNMHGCIPIGLPHSTYIGAEWGDLERSDNLDWPGVVSTLNIELHCTLNITTMHVEVCFV